MAARARTFVAVAAGDVSDDRLQWIEVMPTADKARNGRFYFTVTRDDLDAFADYIRENGDRIVVDYDHEGAEGGSTVAAGWFTGEADVRETGDGARLYAQVEWTPQGLEDVQTKRFRFISPEFSFKERDSKTGLLTKAKEIIAATLTNRPFFAELAAVADADDDNDDELTVAEVLAMQSSEDEAVRARAAGLIQTLINGGDPAKPSKEEEMNDALKAVASELGLADDTTDEHVLDAVKAAKTAKPAAGDDTVVLDKDTVAQLTASAKKGEDAHAELAALKIKTLLDEAIRDRKILPVQRDGYAAMAAADFDGVKALLESTPKDAIATATRGKGGAGEDDGTPEGREVETVKARFASELGDDAPDEQAALHVKATQILGKTSYTPEEYVTAYAQAEAELDIVYRERPRDDRD